MENSIFEGVIQSKQKKREKLNEKLIGVLIAHQVQGKKTSIKL